MRNFPRLSLSGGLSHLPSPLLREPSHAGALFSMQWTPFLSSFTVPSAQCQCSPTDRRDVSAGMQPRDHPCQTPRLTGENSRSKEGRNRACPTLELQISASQFKSLCDTLMRAEYFYEINTHSKESVTILLLQQIRCQYLSSISHRVKLYH